MRILFINNDGGGFADHIEVAAETTLAALFAQRLPGRERPGEADRREQHRIVAGGIGGQ